MAGEGKPGAGKAAIDEVRVLLDVAQTPAGGALEVVVVGEGDIGRRAAP